VDIALIAEQTLHGRFRAAFAASGHRIVGTASQAADAIRMAGSVRADVAVCDVGLPGCGPLGGLDVAEVLAYGHGLTIVVLADAPAPELRPRIEAIAGPLVLTTAADGASIAAAIDAAGRRRAVPRMAWPPIHLLLAVA